VPELVEEPRRMSAERTVVLLDYEANGDADDLARPLSHASLVKRHVEGVWPA